MGLGPFPWGLSQLPACCHHPTAYLPQGRELGFLPVFPDLELFPEFPDLELLLEFPDLDLVLGFPDLELVLVFQALGQVQVRGLQGWAEMTPELRGGRPLSSQHIPQHLIMGLVVNSPLGFPEQ